MGAAAGPVSNAPSRLASYAWSMLDPEALHFMANLGTTLTSKFGDGITLSRYGNSVQWSYAGQSAVVELRPGGSLEATFVARPSLDGVSSTLVAGVYRKNGTRYRLSPEGCSRMVDDMVEFFQGTREPRFTFVNAV
jgi:hypothetical protein